MWLILSLLLLLPMSVSAQSGSSQEVGGMTLFNFGDVSGTGQSVGNMEYYNFSNGQTATRQTFGNTDMYSSPSPNLGGTVQRFGNQGFGNWNDGTRSTHQSIGTMQFDTFQRGNQTTTCTSQRIGQQTFTNCR